MLCRMYIIPVATDVNFRMAELSMMTSSPATDFVSMYTSKTCSPVFSLNDALSQLKFSPSPTKSTPDFHPDVNNMPEMQGLLSSGETFCTKETVAACIAYLNQVQCQNNINSNNNNPQPLYVHKTKLSAQNFHPPPVMKHRDLAQHTVCRS